VLDGIKAGFPSATVLYEKGAGIEPGETGNLTAAIEAAKLADLIVVVIGDRLIYYGEGKSTATLALMGTQLALLNAIVDLKKPFVIDIIASKPLILPANIIDAASAIIAQFSPGMLGGTAFAEAIAADINPSGKLTISIPLHIGQIPIYYNLIRGQHGDRYSDLTELPRWAFGYGLSYSTFQYSNPSLNKDVFSIDEDIIVKFTLTNRGPYDGDEIVQIYISDIVASVTWPIQELKAFQRVSVPAYQAVQVTIVVKSADCTIVTPDGKRVVESGDFELRIAQASDNLILRLPFSIQ
jgi:beta-glucosidase